ncbi:MAG: EAL domain-containing protein, partial [Oscillospiraceae bacterium]|nr:EAL domain-containing protein [Oscillospiraceae bacterium]
PKTIFLLIVPMILLGVCGAIVVSNSLFTHPHLINVLSSVVTVMIILYLLFLAVTIFITFVLSASFSNRYSKPYDSIIKTMEKVMAGDLTVRCNVEGETSSSVYIATFLNEMLSIIEDDYHKIEKNQEDILKTAAKLKANEENYLNILMVANDAIFEWDIEKSTVSVSDQWNDVVGEKPDENGFTADSFFSLFDLSEEEQKSLNNFLNEIAGDFSGELKLAKKSPDERQRWVLFKAIGLFNDTGKTCKVVASFSDITKRVEDANKLQYLAYYDALTGLLKYTRFMELADIIVSDERNENKLKAMALIDLDGFKHINDTLGHNVGDFAIQSAADKIRRAVEGKGIACRFGGDEFVLLLDAIACEQDAYDIIEDLRADILNPLIYEEHTIVLSASIGVAFFPKHSTNLFQLFKFADYSMYQAKHSGKNQLVSFTSEIGREEQRKSDILHCLKGVYESNELKIYYQPLVSASTGKITGFEALLRLFSQEIGLISPAEFIPIAEENGLMYNLGLWILQRVCEDLARFANDIEGDISMTVNISTIQLTNPNFPKDIAKIFENAGVSPENIEFDVSADGSFVFDKQVKNNIYKISEMGVKVAIDDFGLGSASLKNFQDIPANSIKIDKKLIKNITSSSKDYEIVKMATNLAHSLNVKVIAKGIENGEQQVAVKDIGCDDLQGFYFSEPIHKTDSENLLKNMKTYQIDKKS